MCVLMPPCATLPPSQVCERLAAAGVQPTHPVFRRAAAALRDADLRLYDSYRTLEVRVPFYALPVVP